MMWIQLSTDKPCVENQRYYGRNRGFEIFRLSHPLDLNKSYSINQNFILEKQINYANLSNMDFQQNISYLNPRDGKV
jgi:hypothetical protein